MIRQILVFVWFMTAVTSANAQLVHDSIKVGKKYRTFHFNRPKGKSDNFSLVFVLHGSGGNGLDMMKSTSNMLLKTPDEKVLFVYPDGYKRYWNECRKAASSLANKMNINEEDFFLAMIQYFKTRYEINEDQVFAVGTSGGGHMCYKLALVMPKKIRAITAIIANLPAADNMDCTEAKVALPVMIVNGTDDPLNKYEGGMMQSGDFVMGNVRATEKSFRYFAELAGYHNEPIKTLLEDTDVEDGKKIERYTYKEKGQPEVTLLKVIGGKHDYPNDIDVHLEAWQFFKRQLQ